MGSTWHDLKLGRRTVQGIRVTQQLTKQELADGAARWACRTWAVAVMAFLDHGIMRQNVGEVAASWGQNVGA